MKKHRAAIFVVIVATATAAYLLPIAEWTTALADRARSAGAVGVLIVFATYIAATVAILPGSLPVLLMDRSSAWRSRLPPALLVRPPHSSSAARSSTTGPSAGRAAPLAHADLACGPWCREPGRSDPAHCSLCEYSR